MFSVVSVSTQEGEFAFRLSDVQEVLLLPSLQPHPEAHSVIEGWFQLRGRLVPVVSLARVLGQADPPAELTDHLVLSKCHPVAWRVQGVNDVVSIEGGSLEMVHSTPDEPRMFLAQYRRDGEVVVLLNAAELLPEEDSESLMTSQKSVSFG